MRGKMQDRAPISAMLGYRMLIKRTGLVGKALGGTNAKNSSQVRLRYKARRCAHFAPKHARLDCNIVIWTTIVVGDIVRYLLL